MFSFKPAFLALSCAALSALAAPYTAKLDKREVFDPKITSPAASTVWTVGQTVDVTWDTSTIPSGQTVFGMLVLGFLTDDSENLDIDNPLAANITLNDGKTSITVPTVDPKTNYIVVLFGDSGNASPEFTIKAATTTSSATGGNTLIGTITSSLLGGPGPISHASSTATSPVTASITTTATASGSAITSTTPGGPLSSSASALSSSASVLTNTTPGGPMSTGTSPTSSASSTGSSASASASASSAGSNSSAAPRTAGATMLSLLAGATIALALCL
ncbi:hypothetical protein PENSPDRAFT_574146 [Peniophora sp. CONT]|nr:hypothetical protein PENSPDRAFT_574146 [Peniophora sp. CONT]